MTDSTQDAVPESPRQSTLEFVRVLFEEFSEGLVFRHNGHDWIMVSSRDGLRGALRADGRYQCYEQNPLTHTDYARRANSGERIVWFFDNTGRTQRDHGTNYYALIEGGVFYRLNPKRRVA